MKPTIGKTLLLILALGIYSAPPAAAQNREFVERYKAGLDAIESEDWQEAAGLMQKAIEGRREESRRLPKFLYLKPYLPHFYLGLARFELGNCTGALDAWRVSESFGVVQKRPQHQQIELARELCRTRAASSGQDSSRPRALAESRPAARRPESVGGRSQEPATLPRERRGEVPSSSSRSPAPVFQRRPTAPAGPPPAALLKAASALFGGSYRDVVEKLKLEDLPDDYSRAHANLLLGAAELALFFESGEAREIHLDRARDSVVEARTILPDLEPPERYFSPRFLDFFYGQRPEEEEKR